MTTPEQLAKWREDAALAYMADDIAMVTTSTRHHFIAGYLRAKEETEQSLKVDDHQIALLVNSLTYIAKVYHGHASLHQCISSEVVPLFHQAIEDARKQALEDAIETFEPVDTLITHGGVRLALIQKMVQ